MNEVESSIQRLEMHTQILSCYAVNADDGSLRLCGFDLLQALGVLGFFSEMDENLLDKQRFVEVAETYVQRAVILFGIVEAKLCRLFFQPFLCLISGTSKRGFF